MVGTEQPVEGLTRTKGGGKRNSPQLSCLTDWAGTSCLIFSCLRLRFTPAVPWFSGLYTQRESHHWLFWVSRLQIADDRSRDSSASMIMWAIRVSPTGPVSYIRHTNYLYSHISLSYWLFFSGESWRTRDKFRNPSTMHVPSFLFRSSWSVIVHDDKHSPMYILRRCVSLLAQISTYWTQTWNAMEKYITTSNSLILNLSSQT